MIFAVVEYGQGGLWHRLALRSPVCVLLHLTTLARAFALIAELLDSLKQPQNKSFAVVDSGSNQDEVPQKLLKVIHHNNPPFEYYYSTLIPDNKNSPTICRGVKFFCPVDDFSAVINLLDASRN